MTDGRANAARVVSGADGSHIRMLLVEDRQHDADFIRMMLKRSSEIIVSIDHVTTLHDAFEKSRAEQYDIILLDLGLPDSSGIDSVTRLRSCSPDTPVVVLTGDDRTATALQAIDSGAQDYLPKQHVVGQLLTRIMHHSIARHNQLVRAQSEALVDGLTGLANRRACEQELERRRCEFTRHQHPLSFAVVDIDHFKSVNDSWGHEVGDQVIRAVADTLAAHVRKSDVVARYGGEEFAIILPMTRLPGAQTVIRRCHQAVSELQVGTNQLEITVSIGVAEIRDGDDFRSLFERADQALYRAKRGGRNRYVLEIDGPDAGDGRAAAAGSRDQGA